MIYIFYCYPHLLTKEVLKVLVPEGMGIKSSEYQNVQLWNYARMKELWWHLYFINSLPYSGRMSLVISLIYGYSCPHFVGC